MTRQYSICATHYNNEDKIRDSVGVLAEEISGRDDWELVVVDAGSDDGSLEYLRELSAEQENVVVIVEPGVSIGEGRQTAVKHSEGSILIQVMDLDAEYYSDGRIFDITEFYEELLDDEGPVQFGAGAYFSTRDLMENLGGWRDLAANEETELKRRALRHGKLRLCSLHLFKGHTDDKGFIERLERFYLNSLSKFEGGVSFWHMLTYWIKNAPGLFPKLGAGVVFPVAWGAARRRGEQFDGSYRTHDQYVMDFQKSVYEQRPDVWIDPPEELREYVIDHRWERIREDQ